VSSQRKANTLADFRGQFDMNVVVPTKIKTALAELLKLGEETWEYESDIIKRAGISQTHMATFREQFVDHNE
jgi:fumarate hydratase class II